MPLQVFQLIAALVTRTCSAVLQAAEVLGYSAIWFGLLAALVKGKDAVEGARRSAGEVKATLWLYLANIIFFAPVIALAVGATRAVLRQYSLLLFDDRLWQVLGPVGTIAVAVLVGDFVGYWRHRAQHTRWLWPAHVIHHSDTQMTWLTLNRFHPVDTLLTDCAEFGCLTALGLPEWALVGHAIVKTFYGEFVHADFPWTYGVLGHVFVSPVMHRWHHARDVEGAGSNFATVFSFYDRAFGTFFVPGPCDIPLGVTDDVRPTTPGRLLHPLRCWLKRSASAASGEVEPAA